MKGTLGAIREFKGSSLIESAPLLVESTSAVATAALIAKLSEDYEFLSATGSLDIPADYAAKVEAIGDKDPMFIVMAMPSGPSRYLDVESVGNENDPEFPHRFYPEEVMMQFADDINERRPPGFAGHETWLSDGSLPENVPVHWVAAAKTRRRKDGRYVTLARGYVTRQGNYREQIQLGIIDSASINAVGQVELRKWTGTIENGDADNPNAEEHYVEFVKAGRLLSFDLVKKDMHGVPGTKLVATKESKLMEWKDLSPEMQKLVTELSESMLKEGNPALYQRLTQGNSTTPNKALDEFAEKCTTLQREKVELSHNASIAEKTAEVLGCKVTELVAKATELSTVSSKMVAERVKSLCAAVKNPKIREIIGKRMAEGKFATVEDAEKAFNNKVAEYREIVGETAVGVGLTESPSTTLEDSSSFVESGSMTPAWLLEAEKNRKAGVTA